MVLNAGIVAPDFTLPNEEGIEISLSAFRGQKVILYFYPKDDTPGCTKEACHFRDDYAEYEKLGVKILGVSPSSVNSHGKFKSKYQLPFTLLADEEHKVCELYGVWGRKKFMGKEYDGVFRTTFLIDQEGMIEKVYKNVKPEPHSKEILDELALRK
ncbi:MAG: thioredoxin-dependent thiol peroxidase [Anaerolineales bacterium]|nr:thioredoxin-dependent thiol peroxidase [Anaerolineales bacterium]